MEKKLIALTEKYYKLEINGKQCRVGKMIRKK